MLKTARHLQYALQRSWRDRQVSLRLSLRIFVTTLCILGILLGLRQNGVTQEMELWGYDLMMRSRVDLGPDPRLLLVEINEKDIQANKNWPFTDLDISRLISKLQTHDPAVIGLDIYRDVPQYDCADPVDGRQTFISELNKSGVIVIQSLGLPGQAVVPAPEGVKDDQIGFNDFVQDSDGVIRRNLMFAKANNEDKTLTSFSLRIVMRYLELKKINYTFEGNKFILGEAEFYQLGSDDGGYQGEDMEGYQSFLNYRTGNQLANKVSYHDVIEGRVDPAWIKDKIVVIGSTAESAKDLTSTPYTSGKKDQHNSGTVYTSGVVVHAYKVSDLLSQALNETASSTHPHPISIGFWSEGIEILWIIFWGLLGSVLLWYTHRPIALLMMILGSVGSLIVTTLILFSNGLWVPLIMPLFAFLIGSGGVLLTRFIYHAFYDHLTGLPNNASFAQQLRRKYTRLSSPDQKLDQEISVHLAERKNIKPCVAILLLDLDRFKTINAVLGHSVGDALLIAFAQRVTHTLEHLSKVDSYLARVGGSEFSILIENPLSIETASQVIDAIHAEMRNPFVLQNEEVFTHANVGIALGFIGEKRDLLRDARSAMNRAKLLEKSEAEVFETDMEALAIARFNLERDLRHAINRQEKDHNGAVFIPEFHVHYQPLVNMKSGRISGFEALVRWHHPERGIVSPGEFIPVAEETGLIVAIGESVLRQACRQMRAWQKQFPDLNLHMLSVNLSSKQFSQENLVDIVASALEDSQLSPQVLKLEITESAVMADVNSTQVMLQQLKELNVKLSIDDFGTGYSSLEYLTQFPTDTLKVDQSFVRCMDTGEENKVVVDTIIALAHNLKMDVVAEGIETKAQLEQLRSLGCEYGQGYLFSKPVNTEMTEILLVDNPRW